MCIRDRVYKEKRTEIVQMVQNNQIKIRKDMELIELPEDYKKCSSGGEAVVRKNNGSYTIKGTQDEEET